MLYSYLYLNLTRGTMVFDGGGSCGGNGGVGGGDGGGGIRGVGVVLVLWLSINQSINQIIYSKYLRKKTNKIKVLA